MSSLNASSTAATGYVAIDELMWRCSFKLSCALECCCNTISQSTVDLFPPTEFRNLRSRAAYRETTACLPAAPAPSTWPMPVSSAAPSSQDQAAQQGRPFLALKHTQHTSCCAADPVAPHRLLKAIETPCCAHGCSTSEMTPVLACAALETPGGAMSELTALIVAYHRVKGTTVT